MRRVSHDACDSKLTRMLELSLIPNTVDSKSLAQTVLPSQNPGRVPWPPVCVHRRGEGRWDGLIASWNTRQASRHTLSALLDMGSPSVYVLLLLVNE